MDNQKILRILRCILTGMTFIYLCIILLRPIGELDFFWHLATGRWIVENLSLPVYDPFNYTTPALLSSREHFILTSYWLSQILYYGIYYMSGLNGFIPLRFVILGVIIYFVYKRAENSNRTILFSVMSVILIVFVQIYQFERPQTFSFLFFAILLYLLEDIKNNPLIPPLIKVGDSTLRGGKGGFRAKKLIVLPLLMLFWANMHGGYVVGLVVILGYLISEGIRFLHPSLKPMRKAAYQRFLIVGISGIVSSLINPNTYKGITYIMPDMLGTSKPSYVLYNMEYLGTIDSFPYYLYPIPGYWLLLLVASIILLCMIIKRRFDIQDAVMLAGLGYFSFTTIRYIAFFLIWAAPFIAVSLTTPTKGEGGDKVTPLHPPSVASRINLDKGRKEGGYLKYTCILLSLFIVVVLITGQKEFDNIKNIANFKGGQWLNSYYPEEAVDFIKENDIKGHMFNYYDWGGYLIWRFYPEKKVFIDPRDFYDFEHLEWRHITDASIKPEVRGMPYYKALLESYRIRYMLVPLFVLWGELPIVAEMIRDREWVAVFLSGNSMIFVKDTPENHDLIRKYAIPKDIFVKKLFGILEEMIRQSPGDCSLYLARGDLYLNQDRFKEARREYERVLELNPFNSTAKERLSFFRRI